jgi:putative peptidoglycan lipid II flippase
MSKSLFRSASLVAMVTILSKILGLLRDQVMAHAYGVSLVSDAYNYAFNIPAFALILLGGLGGPFHTATVSVLSKRIKNNEAPDRLAQKIVNTFITLTGLVFGALAILCFYGAPQISQLIAHQASPQMQVLIASHLQWMSPMVLIGGLIGIFYGIANVYQQFFWPSISPAAINLTLILWLVIWGPDRWGYSLAISTMLGAVLQLGLQLPDYFRAGFRFKPAFSLGEPDLKTMGELLFPATIGTTIGQLNIYVAMFFVSQLNPGSWTALMLANRLIQLPIGVLTIAMLVPLFPRFSQWAGEQNQEAIRSHFKTGLLSLWLLTFPCMVLLVLVGEPAVALLFQRGAFSAEDTHRVTLILLILSCSMVPYMMRDGMTRIFYAFNDSRTPLLAGIGSIVLNAFLNASLVKPFGVMGIALSTVLVTIFNAIVLNILVKKHMASMGYREYFRPVFNMLLAAMVSLGAGYAVLPYFNSLKVHAPQSIGLMILVLGSTLWVAIVYGGVLALLKEPLLIRALQRLKPPR